MVKKTGTVRRIAARTLAAGGAHLAKVLTGDETIAEAAGGTVEDLMTSSSAKASVNAVEAKHREKKAPTARKKATRHKPAGKIKPAKKKATTT
jgi:hypothetical protein